jgi:hypothetical protein
MDEDGGPLSLRRGDRMSTLSDVGLNGDYSLSHTHPSAATPTPASLEGGAHSQRSFTLLMASSSFSLLEARLGALAKTGFPRIILGSASASRRQVRVHAHACSAPSMHV